MRYNNTNYEYVRNIFGDVVAICNEAGGHVAFYSYDAWGNCTIEINQNNIANINPFRYRGYYYDTETNLYYLQTRYYDPEIGQFISMDTPNYLKPDTIGGVDLYAYCGNNPVMGVDPTGEFWNWAIGAVVGAIAGLVGQMISDVVTSFMNGEVAISNWQTYTGAIVGGAMGGAILGGTGNVNVANAVTGFVTTGLGLTLEKLTIEDYDKSWVEIGVNALVDGAISYGLGKLPGIKGITSGRNSMSAVYKSGLTKLRNGTAARMSAKVFGKGILSNIVGGFALDAHYGIKQHAYDRTKNLLREFAVV